MNGTRYESGSTLTITNVGSSTYSTGYANPDLSLVCMTSEVNTECCRHQDGRSVGEWYFPDGSVVPRRKYDHAEDITRSGYNQQVRLNRINDAIGPIGTYTCKVPSQDGCGNVMHIANITLGQL
jgi:hypothetical protein